MSGLITGSFSGSGRPDLLANLSAGNLSDYSGRLSLLRPDLRHPPGRYLAPVGVRTEWEGGEGSAQGNALGDVDGDTHADLVFPANTPGGTRVKFQHGNGDGTFGPAIEMGSLGPSCGGNAKIALADFDGDDHLDVVCMAGTAVVGFGDGAGHVGSATGLPLNTTGSSRASAATSPSATSTPTGTPTSCSP
ncbi:MAG: VCBS repeat-containing protein [Acidimicrobiales bacterium]